jgi:hypothetical protein
MPSISTCANTTSAVLLEMLSLLDAEVGRRIKEQSALAKAAAGEQPSQATNSSSSAAAEVPGDSKAAATSDGLSRAWKTHASPDQSCTSLPEHQVNTGQSGTAVQEALQLASLLPQVSWAQLKAAAQGWGGNGIFMGHMQGLCTHLTINPYLRVLALLATVGKLTEQQQQAVIALLGGGPSSTSADVDSTLSALRTSSAAAAAAPYSNRANYVVNNLSSLPLPEPPSLSAARQEHDLALQDLAMPFVCVDSNSNCPYADRLADHLLLAFGAAQLPHVTYMQESSLAQGSEGSSRGSVQSSLLCGKDILEMLGVDGITEYTRWMSASLLVIINEVLSQS